MFQERLYFVSLLKINENFGRIISFMSRVIAVWLEWVNASLKSTFVISIFLVPLVHFNF